jgi:hypothetical protein
VAVSTDSRHWSAPRSTAPRPHSEWRLEDLHTASQKTNPSQTATALLPWAPHNPTAVSDSVMPRAPSVSAVLTNQYTATSPTNARCLDDSAYSWLRITRPGAYVGAENPEAVLSRIRKGAAQPLIWPKPQSQELQSQRTKSKEITEAKVADGKQREQRVLGVKSWREWMWISVECRTADAQDGWSEGLYVSHIRRVTAPSWYVPPPPRLQQAPVPLADTYTGQQPSNLQPSGLASVAGIMCCQAGDLPGLCQSGSTTTIKSHTSARPAMSITLYAKPDHRKSKPCVKF